MSNWSYKNNSKWAGMYPNCSSKNSPNQSPINISLKDIKQECGAKCEITIKYKPSKCYLVNDHNTITINYDPGSYIIYQNTWYELTKAKIHVPSLHKFNGERYAAEINLYHCTDKQCDSGIILSIPLYRGPDNGESVDFINQFINQAPLNTSVIEREVPVSDDWNIISLIPEDRTCFVYAGSLPHPPCTPGWTWIVFNQPTRIGLTALKTLQHNIVEKSGQNVREVVPLKDYSKVYKVAHEWVKVYEERPVKEAIIPVNPKEVPNNEPPIDTPSKYSVIEDYFNRYRTKLKNLMLFIMIVLIIATSIKFAKYIIRNDIVNKYLVPDNLGSIGNMNMNQGNMGNMNQGQGNMNMNQGNMGNMNQGQGNMNQGQGNMNQGQGNMNQEQGNMNQGQGNMNQGQGNKNQEQGNKNKNKNKK
jgi:carbonic anhydrase